MIYIILKIIITACLIVLISEIAKADDRLGGLIAAMPIVTFLVILWMYYEGNSTDKISSHISYTLLYLLPTIPMFLVFPFCSWQQESRGMQRKLGAMAPQRAPARVENRPLIFREL